jgi:phenylacetate-CoA ligase
MPADSSGATAASALRRRTLLPPSVRAQRRVFSMLRSPAELVPELDAYRPDVIGSYGSYLEALFTYVRERSPRLHPPRVAVYGSDAMSVAVRDWARAALGIEVLSSYNAIEAPQIGYECQHHRGYHLNVDLCPVRLIGADGGDVADGRPGEVVISNLVNRGTVLLNYRLGDLLTCSSDPCPCGRSLPLCSYPERAATSWLDFGDGRTVHAQALKLVLRREREIWRYQIVQEAERRLLVRLVPSPDCDRQATVDRLLARFHEQLGDQIAVRVEFVADLPRGSAGKVQPVVSL